jgi:hypothetical protein
MGLSHGMVKAHPLVGDAPNRTFADVSTPQMAAPTTSRLVDTAISAQNANSEVTPSRIVKREKERLLRSLQPKYLRYNTWVSGRVSLSVADWTLKALPLPSIPINELNNPITSETIHHNPSLFRIITPININRFQSLLSTHPNQLFVKSVCKGLREGFWPWADTLIEGYPTTHDESQLGVRGADETNFLRNQVQIEQDKGRFSLSFGNDLLPGMYSMPIHVVPKPGSSDLRMVTDHSFGSFSLNSMIPHNDISGYPLDTLKHLGEVLLDLHQSTQPIEPLLMFKSDVSEAYRLLPVHEKWQIKQINTIDGLRYVDRCNAFGNRASGSIWISFNSLVTWIARYIKGIDNLLVYVDDSFNVARASSCILYEPFNKLMPRDQVVLMDLWTELGIPFKEKKQVFGAPLTIIGISVDPNNLTFTLPEKGKADLLAQVEDFCSIPQNSRGAKFTLREWQRLAGWLNWSFNVFPLLRPCLNNFYPKISGKDRPNAEIWVNNIVRNDLQWASDHIRESSGVYLLRSLHWGESEADQILYCDACLEGMGFWYPFTSDPVAFYSPVPPDIPPHFIFYYEALCVLSALQHASQTLCIPSRIMIYSDNTNTVDIFHSLRALPAYNFILRSAVDILLKSNHQLRVQYVPSDQNDIADAISRQQFNRALTLCPKLRINFFEPPRLPLGAPKK